MNRSLTNVIFGGIAPTQVTEGKQNHQILANGRLYQGNVGDSDQHRRGGRDAW
jgi:hypothetical protein